MNPLVSCIVPLYNSERFLAETLDSILAQTYKPIEIVLIDDGSSDNTYDVVERYSDRVRYIPQEHGGIPAACNAGVRAARGELISFLDADDLWLPEKTEKQFEMLTAHPQGDASICMVQNFWMPEMQKSKEAIQNQRQAEPMAGFVLQALLVRRETFQTIGYFDESYLHASKTAWFMEAELRGIRIEQVDEVLALRRIHRGNFSHQNATASQQEYLRVLKKYRDLERANRK